jgi:hypothetical protein
VLYNINIENMRKRTVYTAAYRGHVGTPNIMVGDRGRRKDDVWTGGDK